MTFRIKESTDIAVYIWRNSYFFACYSSSIILEQFYFFVRTCAVQTICGEGLAFYKPCCFKITIRLHRYIVSRPINIQLHTP